MKFFFKKTIFFSINFKVIFRRFKRLSFVTVSVYQNFENDGTLCGRGL